MNGGAGGGAVGQSGYSMLTATGNSLPGWGATQESGGRNGTNVVGATNTGDQSGTRSLGGRGGSGAQGGALVLCLPEPGCRVAGRSGVRVPIFSHSRSAFCFLTAAHAPRGSPPACSLFPRRWRWWRLLWRRWWWRQLGHDISQRWRWRWRLVMVIFIRYRW